MPAKAAVIGGAAVVVCAVSAGALLLVPPAVPAGEDSSPVQGGSSASETMSSDPAPDSSEASSEVSSEVSSDGESEIVVLSSEPEGSAPEISSAPVSSAAVSSQTSSAAVSSATSSTASVPVSSEPVSSVYVSSETPVVTVDLPEGYQSKFADAYRQNPNVAGQIVLSGTNLNYYVAWHSTDNNYYINHTLDNQYNVWGNPWLDFRCWVNDTDKQADGIMRWDNIVIYAHSDDTRQLQFAPIKHYQELDFYKNHPTIDFNTVYADETYKVVGFFGENVDQPNSFVYWNSLAFPSQADYDAFISEVRDRSFFDAPVDCQYGDEFLTLSTCVSTTTQHSRYVLVARKVRPGESASVDTSQAVVNADQKPPTAELN